MVGFQNSRHPKNSLSALSPSRVILDAKAAIQWALIRDGLRLPVSQNFNVTIEQPRTAAKRRRDTPWSRRAFCKS
jgi:hypothetical protein